MPRLVRANRKRERSNVGDLSEKIFVENRNLPAPALGLAASDFVFSAHESAAEVWANVESLTGVTHFDEVAGLDRSLSHRVLIRFLAGVSAETWLRLKNGTRLDIVTVTNLDERDEFLLIAASAAGSDTRKVVGQ